MSDAAPAGEPCVSTNATVIACQANGMPAVQLARVSHDLTSDGTPRRMHLWSERSYDARLRLRLVWRRSDAVQSAGRLLCSQRAVHKPTWRGVSAQPRLDRWSEREEPVPSAARHFY